MTAPVHLILGATGGIGSALARTLAARGARLVLGGRRPDVLEALGAELGARTVHVDATSVADIDGAVEVAVREFGRLDGAVNCFGSLLLKPAHLTKPEEFEDVLAVNLRSSFALVRAATRVMMNNTEPAGGSIVLVASAAARIGLANHEAIAAAKGGVIGLTLAAAASYAPKGIRVNCVAPGLVRTPLTARITGSPAAEQASVAMHALGRLGEPQDVATPIAWLLDGETSGFVTGQVVGIDGGLGTLRSR
ncbi:MAG: SDR family oxidoreductase [Gemmatimonadaceae bacterium]|nr:SDR family oxidoreductase [Gemmatimonadaceae bacterium]